MILRINKAYKILKKESLDCLLVSSRHNISYLTNFPSRDSFLLVSKKKNLYLTDSRYTYEAKAGLKGTAIIKQINNSLFKTIADVCHNLGIKRIGFEDKNLTFSQYNFLRLKLDKTIELIPTHGVIEKLREIKSQEELIKIKKAVWITKQALKHIEDFILPGKSEIEIAAELEHFIRYNGARTSAFEIIVASGSNSSYPHHLTSDRRIRHNDLVLIDLGVEYMGYKSDLTRVFFLGKIGILAKKTLGIVKEAQKQAISKIKPGVSIAKIDKSARDYIAKRGYGKYFSHNLGHGIGLEVHELPIISSRESNRLKEGMVFTIEPAIYIPNKFGIRIEDIILVTKKGCEVINGILDK